MGVVYSQSLCDMGVKYSTQHAISMLVRLHGVKYGTRHAISTLIRLHGVKYGTRHAISTLIRLHGVSTVHGMRSVR